MNMNSSPPPRTPTSAEIDELDEEFHSETEEDPNVFVIRSPLQRPDANVFTTRQLHSLAPLTLAVLSHSDLFFLKL